MTKSGQSGQGGANDESFLQREQRRPVAYIGTPGQNHRVGRSRGRRVGTRHAIGPEELPHDLKAFVVVQELNQAQRSDSLSECLQLPGIQ